MAALVLLGGGGAGAYFYFQKPAEAAGGEHAKAAAKPKKDSHAHSAVFVQMDPLILPVIGNNGVSQVLSLVIVLETSDEKYRAEIQSMAPRLKDAFIQDMYGVLSHSAMMQDGVLQVGILKDRLHKISNHVMGDGKVDQVLLQVVQQRSM